MEGYKLKLRDVMEVVPKFSGTSKHATFKHFSTMCLNFVKMISPQTEISLIKMIKFCLVDEAKSAVRDKCFKTVHRHSYIFYKKHFY